MPSTPRAAITWSIWRRTTRMVTWSGSSSPTRADDLAVGAPWARPGCSAVAPKGAPTVSSADGGAGFGALVGIEQEQVAAAFAGRQDHPLRQAEAHLARRLV